MCTLVYRFDDADSFHLLDSDTTARGPVTVRVETAGGNSFLRVAFRRKGDDPPRIAAVLALPLVAIDGHPRELRLDVLGNADGCHLTAEAGDAEGWGFAYSFGRVDFTGLRTCTAKVATPSEYWGTRKTVDIPGIVPPLQLFRLLITTEQQCQAVDIGLAALSVTGDVRVASPGIATDKRLQSPNT